MTTTIWLCEEHYQEACKNVGPARADHAAGGYEIPILTIYNAFGAECEAPDCEHVAKYLIDKVNKK